ncbi:hypothetical protein BJ912DRAFT_1064500 [Pholiota molesta]|nr:hypothetical protein BJ912DRAFT_1064500 [Pholiota molesta]
MRVRPPLKPVTGGTTAHHPDLPGNIVGPRAQNSVIRKMKQGMDSDTEGGRSMTTPGPVASD